MKTLINMVDGTLGVSDVSFCVRCDCPIPIVNGHFAGSIGMITAHYGSCHDEDTIALGLCDGCLNTLLTKKIVRIL